MGVTVGIDPSLSALGFMAVDTGTGEVLHKEVVGYSLKKGAAWPARHKRIMSTVEHVDALIDEAIEHMDDLDAIVIEGPSLGSRGASLFYAGELESQLMESLSKWTVKHFLEVPPSNLKKFATGKGNANKPLVAAHVAKRWEHIFGDDNLTDAFVLCQIGRAVNQTLEALPKANASALDKVIRHDNDTGADSS